MTYYLIAGERSGDLHGGNLIRAIRSADPDAHLRAWGGNDMAAAGATLVRHYRELAFMGFLEVVRNLGTIQRLLHECRADLLAHRPDVLILIDYAGFNLRMARFARRNGIRVFYYISPKVWAWNPRRALGIKQNVDRLFTIFPFETAFFRRYDYEVSYVGNPLMDAIAAFRPDPDFLQKIAQSATGDARPVVALLPGSRRQEVQTILPLMLAATTQFSDYQFIVGTVDNLPTGLYDDLLAGFPTVRRAENAAYDLLTVATAALVTSGTATLETGLFRVPQVVCYRTSPVSYAIARRLIAVPYISLVNLILGREAVKELIQNDLTPDQIATELTWILPNGSGRDQQLLDYAELQTLVGGPGASARAGQQMVALLREAAL
jgi:lipid-A-disaccharide synthase